MHSKTPFASLLIVLLLCSTSLLGNVIISEFDATNCGTASDEDGSERDWIELRNTGGSSVNLAGWALSDDATDPGKWIFPSTTLASGQHLLVFASDKNWQLSGYELHTNFKLAGNGGDILLSRPDGAGGWIAEHTILAYPPQLPLVTYGYANGDGTGSLGFIETPTPGTLNGPDIVQAFVSDTDFDQTRGYYNTPFNLTITSATPGAHIIYTTDGSEPSMNNGTLVPAASEQLQPVAIIPITTTTIVRARAMKAGLGSTNIDTHTYLFAADVLNQSGADISQPYADWGHSGPDWDMDPVVTTHSNPEDRCVPEDLMTIPAVSVVMNWNDLFGTEGPGIYIEGEGVPKRASFELLNPDGNDADPNLSPAEHGRGVALVFGGSSTGKRWKTDKLSLRFNFWQDFDSNVLGPGATGSYDRLVLDARLNQVWTQSQNFEQRQFADYARDAVLSDLENSIGRAGVHSQHVHLFLNGLYWGIYTLHERPDNHFAADYLGGSKDDYDVVKHGPDAPNFLVDGLRINPAAPISNSNYTAGVNYLNMVSLTQPDLSQPANYAALAQVLDIPALVDHMLLNFYGGNYDWPQHNWYATYNRKDPEGKWRFHSWDAEHVFKYVDYPRYDNETTKFEGWDRPDGIHLQLLDSPEYRFLFADTAHKYLFNDGAFAVTKVWALFENRFDDIDEAIRAESARWGDSGQQNIDPSNPLYQERHLRYSNIPSSVPSSWVGRSDTTDFASWWHERERIRTKILGPEPNRRTRFIGQLRNAVYNEDHPLGNQPNPLYPMTDAPVFGQHGGIVEPGYALTMANPNSGGIIYFTTDGSDPREPYSDTGTFFSGAVNSTATAYAGAVSLDATTRVKARVLNNGEWSALNEAVFNISGTTTVPASAANLVISEIHYHPSDASLDELNAGFTDDGEFEYFEVLNFSNQTVSLLGLSVEQGLDIATSIGDIEELAPGAYAVYVANPAAFAYRYGQGHPIAGRFAFDTSLNNGGERLHLLDALGSTIVDLTYDDRTPWPITPDGYGPSMVLVQPGHRDPTMGWNWRASVDTGGTPGADAAYLTYEDWADTYFHPDDPGYPLIKEPEQDPDQDGMTNLEELFFGTDPGIPTFGTGGIQMGIESVDTGTGPRPHIVVTLEFNRLAEEVYFFLMASTDLSSWSDSGFVLYGVPQVLPGGSEIHRYRSILPLEGSLERLFFQLSLELNN
ncbi:MAG: lamin tail domain-containing protein [Puniceicoccaceae bacterium]